MLKLISKCLRCFSAMIINDLTFKKCTQMQNTYILPFRDIANAIFVDKSKLPISVLHFVELDGVSILWTRGQEQFR